MASGTEPGVDEATRLAALIAGGVLDTPPESTFDDFVQLARTVCRTPMAQISLLDADGQWLKVHSAFAPAETPIDLPIFAHVIREREILVIPDLVLDPSARANTLVTGPPHIRFYAGIMLRTPQGKALGALCVIDTKPRPAGLTAEQAEGLLALGRQTTVMLQFRRALRSRDDAARAQSDRAAAADSAQQAGGIGTFEIDMHSNTLRPSPEFCRLFGLPPTPAMDAGVIERIVIPEDREKASSLDTRTDRTTMLEAEYRIRRADDGELRWLSRRGEVRRDADGRPVLLRGAMQDITERKRVEALQETLNREISHRIKNTLAMVDAIALQTLRHAADRAAVQNFSRRIQALGRAHDILISRSLSGADLRTTVTTVASVIADPGRIVMHGPEITLNARTTLSFSLLIHELATNAAKYGALSDARGIVRVDWSTEATPKGRQLVLTWREEGGPPVAEPTRKGFGSRLIESGFAGTGGVEVRYREEGLHATFRVPLSFITG